MPDFQCIDYDGKLCRKGRGAVHKLCIARGGRPCPILTIESVRAGRQVLGELPDQVRTQVEPYVTGERVDPTDPAPDAPPQKAQEKEPLPPGRKRRSPSPEVVAKRVATLKARRAAEAVRPEKAPASRAPRPVPQETPAPTPDPTNLSANSVEELTTAELVWLRDSVAAEIDRRRARAQEELRILESGS